MNIQVEFKSDKFLAYEGESETINPGVWGKRLAEYLQQNLGNQGLTVTTILSEDWGWMVEIENPEFPLWVGCGHQDGDDDEFLCFIEPSKPYVKKFFKRIDATEQIGRVSSALQRVLESDPDIRDLRWTPMAAA